MSSVVAKNVKNTPYGLVCILCILFLFASTTAEAARGGRRRRAKIRPPKSPAVVEEPPAVSPPQPPPEKSQRPAELKPMKKTVAHKPRLAVLGFEGKDLRPEDLRAVEDSVSSAAAKYAPMDVVGAADMRAMLNLGTTQQLMGCGQAACLTQFGDLLASQRLLTGSVQSFGKGYRLTMRLLDLTNGTIIKSLTLDTKNTEPYALVGLATANVPALFGVVGRIAIWDQPKNGEVFLDDRFVGKTPVSYISARTAGEHTLRIDGPGITRWETVVNLAPGEDARVRALSRSFASLELQASDRRQFGYWTGAGALVTAVVAGVFYGLAAQSNARLRRMDRRRVSQLDLDSVTSTTLAYSLSAIGVGVVAAGLTGSSAYTLLVNPAADLLENSR